MDQPLRWPLRRQADRGREGLRARRLDARWGESELDGSVRADFAAAKPWLDGRLQAQRLDLATMLPLLASSDQSPASPDASSNPLKSLAGYEGRLELAAAEIDLPSNLVLHDTAATLELANGKLRLAPMQSACQRVRSKASSPPAPWTPTTSPSIRARGQ